MWVKAPGIFMQTRCAIENRAENKRSFLDVACQAAMQTLPRFCFLLASVFYFSGCANIDSNDDQSWLSFGRKSKQEKDELARLAIQAREIHQSIQRNREETQKSQQANLGNASSTDLDRDLEQSRLIKEMYEKTEDPELKRMLASKMPTMNKDSQSFGPSESTAPFSKSENVAVAAENSLHTSQTDRQSANHSAATMQPVSVTDNIRSNHGDNLTAQSQSVAMSIGDGNVAANPQNHNDLQIDKLLNSASQSREQKLANSARFVEADPVYNDHSVRTVQYTDNPQNQPPSNNLQDESGSNNATGNREPAHFSEQSELASQHKPMQIGDWKRKLLETVELLEQTKKAKQFSESEQAYLDLCLRLLHLIQGNREQAVAAVESLSPEEQEFWKEQFFAISRIITDPADESSGVFVSRQKQAFRALPHLRNATSHLASIANLDVKNLHWCTEIHGFGQFTEANQYSVKPGNEYLIYCEIENWSIEENATDQGARYTSKIQASYAIVDEAGGVVKQNQFPPITDVGRNRRRDFYLVLRTTIPTNLSPGTYHLQLSVDDLIGSKTATSKVPLTFNVR
jgi:hypothetical protein